MSDRLNELQRQRALIQEHLSWLDRQIAAEAGGARPSGALPHQTATPGTPLPSVPMPDVVSRPSASPYAEKILSQYRVEPDIAKNDLRKGCLMYFAAALAAVGLAVVALYFYSTRAH